MGSGQMGVEGGSVSRRVCKRKTWNDVGCPGCRSHEKSARSGWMAGREVERETRVERTTHPLRRTPNPPEASRSAHARMPDSVMVITEAPRGMRGPRRVSAYRHRFRSTFRPEFPRLPKHARLPKDRFAKRLAVPAQCGRRHGDGGGADAPQGGAHSGPARGVFPPSSPLPEPEPEPEEVEPAEPDAEAEAVASDDAAEPEPPADPEPEPEEGAGRLPGGRRGAPVDSGARRVPEAHGRDRRQGTRACRPEPRTEPSVKPNVPKRVPFFFLSERGEPTAVFVISPRSAGPRPFRPHAALDPIRVTHKKQKKNKKQKHPLSCFAAGASDARKRTSTPRRRRRRRRSSARWRLPTPCTRCATG